MRCLTKSLSGTWKMPRFAASIRNCDSFRNVNTQEDWENIPLFAGQIKEGPARSLLLFRVYQRIYLLRSSSLTMVLTWSST